MLRSVRFLMIPAALLLAGAPDGLAAQEVAPPDTVVLSGAPLGDVTFSHAAHATMTECVACHHESRPEMPLESEYQPCSACHTKSPTPPMTTSIRDAYHDARAQSGICVDCHTEETTSSEATVPVRCTECHVRKKE